MPSHQRYCCVCQNFGGKVIDGTKVSMHRFPADLRLRKVWIQRCRNACPNFVFVNSDQTRLCGVHFVGRRGPTKGDPLPCFFLQAAGGEKVYKLTTLENVPEADENNSTPETEEMSDNHSPDLSFESDAVGLLVDSSASLLDVSLRLHDYGKFTPVPAIIRHQCQQVQPEMVSVGTQTDETRVPRSISTQTTIETSTAGIQVDRPSFTFENIRDDDSKVLFYTGIPNAGTFECLFDEISVGMQGSNSGRPKSLRLIDEFLMVLMRLRLGLLLEDLADRFHVSVGSCSTIFNRWVDNMDSGLSFLVKWPSRKNINDTMPERFRGNTLSVE